jgi:hypothetical protein
VAQVTSEPRAHVLGALAGDDVGELDQEGGRKGRVGIGTFKMNASERAAHLLFNVVNL